ncbi:MAG: hypothetical protein AABX69_04330 [Nanoarchaeota archaeon]
MAVSEAVKTTVLLRKDVYHAVVQSFGKRKLSSTINNLLFEQLIKPRRSMFGVSKGMKPFVREHHDRY